MTYDERKKQLYQTMKEELLSRPNGFWFEPDRDGPKYFCPKYLGEERMEYLTEVYLDDEEYDQIIVNTLYEDQDGKECVQVSSFSEFSNDEMATIMHLCGVEVPMEGEFYVE